MTIGQYQRHLNEFPNGNLGASITIDFHTNGIYQSGVLNSVNCVLTFLPPRVHSTIWIELIQDITGGRTVSFPGTVVGTPPPLNSAPNASTVFEMLWNGTNYQFTSNNGAAQTSLSYSNLNGISFGIAGSTLTASYTVPSTTGLISRINVSAGTTSNNLSAITFSNSNGLSFGLNGSTITGSYTVPSTAGLISAVNVSAGTTSNNVSNFVFSNSNGLSFGLNGSTITGSVAAAVGQTNQTVGLYALGNTTQNSSTTLDARTLSFNALGAMTMGYSNGSIQVSAPVVSSLSATGIVSISSNGSTISIGASQSVQTQNVVLPSAGTQTATSGTVVFSNSNGISFGMSNSSIITASYTVPSTAGLISAVNVSAGTTSNNISNFVFSNSNGVSFGLNGSTITGSVGAAVGQTNQTLGFYALGNTTQNSSTTLDARTLSFNALGAMTWGYSNGSIQVSAPVVSSLSATGAVSISSNGSTISIGAPVQSVQTVGLYALGNTTQNSSTTLDARTLSFNGLGIITAGYSNGSIQISATQSAQTQNIVLPSAGTQTATSGTVVWSNSNNITFGMSGSSRITASYNFSISAGTSSGFGNGMTLTNSNNVSFTNNAGVIQAFASPHTADVINDSNVSGANVNIALNNLLLEFPDGLYTEAVNFTLAGSKLGQVGLITASNITCTIPTHATDPTLITGSRFSFINYGGNIVFNPAVGVTIHAPTQGYPTQNYCRFNCLIVTVDEWIITYEIVSMGTDNIVNNSSVTGASDSAALNELLAHSFTGDIVIPLNITLISIGSGTSQMQFSPTVGWEDQAGGVGGTYFVCQLGPLPTGITIDNVKISIVPPTGHGGSIGSMTKPKAWIYQQVKTSNAPGLLASQVDPSASFAVYESPHDITVSFTAASTTGNSYWLYFTCETGTNALTGTLLTYITVHVPA